MSSELAKEWLEKINGFNELALIDKTEAKKQFYHFYANGFTQAQAGTDDFQQSIWASMTALADKYNEPHKFTAFIGYEWTQILFNLHRVVIFKDSAKKASSVRPFSQFDSSDPEDLWSYMAAYEENVGGEVLAIPHNGNLSSGIMFALEDVSGNPFSESYAKRRSRWEPLFEVTQIKGDSEVHPMLATDDEFADFETILSKDPEKGLWSDGVKSARGLNYYNSWIKKQAESGDKNWMRNFEYARPALKLGLQEQARLGVNPFKFGLIGSTDAHTALATADNDNFWGKSSGVEPNPDRIKGSWFPARGDESKSTWSKNAWTMNAAGYAAIWSQENTRESLFAAMKRKEVYASTGPRITVRFFGGWDYQPDDAFKPDLARIGYEKGVPMGGDLAAAPDNKAPNFLIRAVKDPDGANLDRVQVIKGWHDANGELHEKIYNVALSDKRKPNWRGKVKPVGTTVDVADASYTNTIGDPELAVVWTDPDFNQNELAFYYLRVLEIPTPRWPAYDAKYFGLKDLPDDIPMITQERAYTSPIWFTPHE